MLDRVKAKALEITENVVVARMSNSSIVTTKEGGENVGNFFNAIYETILPVVEQMEKSEK